MLRILRAHGLIHKVPHTHRYQVSEKGRQVIAAVQARILTSLTQLSSQLTQRAASGILVPGASPVPLTGVRHLIA